MKKAYSFLFLLTLLYTFSSAQSILNPYVETVDDIRCYISKIETNKKHTIISFEYHSRPDWWVRLNNNIYIEGPDNIKYSYIKSEGIPMAPKKHTFSEGEGNLNFKVYFEPLPENVKTINILENYGAPRSFSFYNVNLKKSRTSDIQRFDKIIKTDLITDTVNPVTSADEDILTDTPEVRNKAKEEFMRSLVSGNLTSLYNTMASAMLDSFIACYNQPGKLAELARLNKNYYDALIQEGFTNDQALQIIISNPLIPQRIPEGK